MEDQLWVQIIIDLSSQVDSSITVLPNTWEYVKIPFGLFKFQTMYVNNFFFVRLKRSNNRLNIPEKLFVLWFKDYNYYYLIITCGSPFEILFCDNERSEPSQGPDRSIPFCKP